MYNVWPTKIQVFQSVNQFCYFIHADQQIEKGGRSCNKKLVFRIRPKNVNEASKRRCVERLEILKKRSSHH